MNVDVVPSGSIGLEMMRDLEELREQLQVAGLDAQGARAALPGVKDGGLTVAIAISGVVLSGISTLVSVLTYWSSNKAKYTLTLSAGGTTLEMAQLDKAGIQAAMQQLRSAEASGMTIRVGER